MQETRLVSVRERVRCTRTDPPTELSASVVTTYSFHKLRETLRVAFERWPHFPRVIVIIVVPIFVIYGTYSQYTGESEPEVHVGLSSLHVN